MLCWVGFYYYYYYWNHSINECNNTWIINYGICWRACGHAVCIIFFLMAECWKWRKWWIIPLRERIQWEKKIETFSLASHKKRKKEKVKWIPTFLYNCLCRMNRLHTEHLESRWLWPHCRLNAELQSAFNAHLGKLLQARRQLVDALAFKLLNYSQHLTKYIPWIAIHTRYVQAECNNHEAMCLVKDNSLHFICILSFFFNSENTMNQSIKWCTSSNTRIPNQFPVAWTAWSVCSINWQFSMLLPMQSKTVHWPGVYVSPINRIMYCELSSSNLFILPITQSGANGVRARLILSQRTISISNRRLNHFFFFYLHILYHLTHGFSRHSGHNRDEDRFEWRVVIGHRWNSLVHVWMHLTTSSCCLLKFVLYCR